MDEIDSQLITNTTKINFFKRLFRGDISLPVTYWVFGVGVGLVIRLCNYLIELYFFEIILYDYGIALIKTYHWLTVIITVLLLIAIWRSASKYKFSKVWATVAKIIVILRFFVLFVTLYNQFFMDSETALRNEILLTNKSLPTMIDKDTRFDKMSLSERNLYYHYTLVDIDESAIDLNYFKVIMHTSLVENLCSSEISKELLQGDWVLIHKYNDKNNEYVADIVVDKLDCN